MGCEVFHFFSLPFCMVAGLGAREGTVVIQILNPKQDVEANPD
jgi:hypothetical protein